MNRTPLRHALLTLLVASVLLTMLPINSVAFPRTVDDGLGGRLHLVSAPQRIFSTGLAMDNMLLSIVDPSRVVGVTIFAKDPHAGSYVADRVQGHMILVDALSPELIIAADPDLVLVASWNDPDAVAQIRLLGYPVYTFANFNSVDDALDNLLVLGELTGEEAAAQELVRQFRERDAALQQRIGSEKRPTVLYYSVWGSSVGSGTTMDDIIRHAGGINALSQMGLEGWPQIDYELILRMNPEVLITDSGEEFVKQLLNDPLLASIEAVRSGRVYHVDHSDALDHRLLLAIESLARKLHPQAFQGATP